MTPERLLPAYVRLTNRQQQVLELTSAGLSNADIAARLYVEPCVVAEHLTNIYAELGTLSADIQPNRYLLIRYFTLFFHHYPNLARYEDTLLLV